MLCPQYCGQPGRYRLCHVHERWHVCLPRLDMEFDTWNWTDRASNFFLSSTMIEPELEITAPFTKIMAQARSLSMRRHYLMNFLCCQCRTGRELPGSQYCPKDLWVLVGGYSTEFSPGMYSDPISRWNYGSWEFGYTKALAKAGFTILAMAPQNGSKKIMAIYSFLAKWGMTRALLPILPPTRAAIWRFITRTCSTRMDKPENFYKHWFACS